MRRVLFPPFDVSRQIPIENKTSYARLLILSSGYEFLGINSARADFNGIKRRGYVYIPKVD